jgi:hypothetical protein
MMVHRCGKDAEKNLTKIFDMVDSFMEEYNLQNSQERLQGMFVAVSRKNMRQPWKNPNVTALSDYNWEVLNDRSPQETAKRWNPPPNIQKGKHKVIECGETWMEHWYKGQNNVSYDYYGSILPSILNFYIATQATIFIGVDKSSWSADVWTTRYHNGKGSTNYRYTSDKGVVPLDNGGLPPTHLSCRKMQQLRTADEGLAETHLEDKEDEQ